MTEREIEVISGTIVGGRAQRVVVRNGETARDSILDGGAFTTVVALEPGVNAVHVVATNAQGVDAEEIITLQYMKPVEAHGITISSPRDGQTLGAEESPIVVVEGQVTDRGISTVRLLVNDHETGVRVVDGRFRKAVPLLASTLHLRARAEIEGRRYESPAIAVHASAGRVSDALLVLEWPREDVGTAARILATWRSNPGRVDVAPQPVTLHSVDGANPFRPDVLYFRNPKPGVYTFTLSYDGPAPDASVRATMYLPQAGTLAPRPLRPVSPNGGGKVVLARLLLPHGILWEQDDWFTGRSMTADTVTKFRLPEGVTWTERTAALER